MLKNIKRIVSAWLIYTAFCLVIPPGIHRSEEGEASARPDGAGYEERILCIDKNYDALIWRLRLIEAAKEKIVLTTFDFRDDNSGRDIMSALYAAAERGVKVEILADGMNGFLYLRGSESFRSLAAHENVTVRLYNRVNFILPYKINYRMHDKYLIADDFAYILGGRNTNDLFLGNYVEKYNEDRDILVYETRPGEGSSYRQLAEYYDKIRSAEYCKIYDKKPKGKSDLSEHYEKVRKKYPEAFGKTDWTAETEAAESVELIVNSTEPKNKSPKLWNRLVEEMKSGERVLIQTPYVICSGSMYRDLADICAESEGTEMIINAVESGTNPFGCTDYLNNKGKIIGTGMTVYEYLGGQAQHTKTILVGDDLSIVGSCNVDMRSVYLDTEMMLSIRSNSLNAELRARAEVLKTSCRRTAPDGSETDGVNYTPREQSGKKKMIYGILRYAIRPVRHLL